MKWPVRTQADRGVGDHQLLRALLWLNKYVISLFIAHPICTQVKQHLCASQLDVYFCV